MPKPLNLAILTKRIDAANSKGKRDETMYELALKAKVLEINPRSPLIEGLLGRIEDLRAEPDEREEAELKEVAAILIDSALVRSGFEVRNSNE